MMLLKTRLVIRGSVLEGVQDTKKHYDQEENPEKKCTVSFILIRLYCISTLHLNISFIHHLYELRIFISPDAEAFHYANGY